MNLRDRMFARLPKNRQWYEIRNADGDKVVVRIYDEIGYWGTTAADFANEIAGITASEIEVQINSPGGDVFDGLAIYNALRLHPSRVTTRVDGLAASAASVIAQAGDHRVMVQSSQMMIHEAWGIAIGPAAEMREFADLLDQQNDVIAGIYALRGDGDVAHFKALMSAETWFTDEATIAAGLADELLVPGAKASASTDDRLRAAWDKAKADADASNEPEIPAPPPAPESTESDTDDTASLLARSKVREMFGSTALADATTP